jgi:hypothetical protein
VPRPRPRPPAPWCIGPIRRPAAASYAPEPLAAAPAWNAPSTLRAEPRRFDAPSDLPKEKLGFLARMRRVVEPEPELIEPPLSGAAMEAVLPPEDRIKARISDVIRSRARGVGPALITAGMTPVQAAVAARRMEPPVMRPRGPVPLMADTRPGTLPPGAALPQAAEPTPQPRAQHPRAAAAAARRQHVHRRGRGLGRYRHRSLAGRR